MATHPGTGSEPDTDGADMATATASMNPHAIHAAADHQYNADYAAAAPKRLPEYTKSLIPGTTPGDMQITMPSGETITRKGSQYLQPPEQVDQAANARRQAYVNKQQNLTNALYPGIRENRMQEEDHATKNTATAAGANLVNAEADKVATDADTAKALRPGQVEGLNINNKNTAANPQGAVSKDERAAMTERLKATEERLKGEAAQHKTAQDSSKAAMDALVKSHKEVTDNQQKQINEMAAEMKQMRALLNQKMGIKGRVGAEVDKINNNGTTGAPSTQPAAVNAGTAAPTNAPAKPPTSQPTGPVSQAKPKINQDQVAQILQQVGATDLANMTDDQRNRAKQLAEQMGLDHMS